MTEIKYQYYKNPVGELLLGSYDEQLCLCDWLYRTKRKEIDSRLKQNLKAQFIEQKSNIIEKTIEQLEEYFNGTRKKFNLDLLLLGTEFQKKVWRILSNINYGLTVSYSQLATQINMPKAVRAVANANGANALAIIIPCHRIIGKNGTLVGYAGGIKAKQKLLKLETSLFA